MKCGQYFLLLLMFILSCKRKDNPGCLKAISPVGANINPVNPIFNWSKCNNNEAITFNLFAINTNGKQLISTFTTSSAAPYFWPGILNGGTRYCWCIMGAGQASDTAYFVTSYPDSLIVGSYNATVNYFCPPQSVNGEYYCSCCTQLGYTVVTVTQVSPGVVLFKDDGLTHTQFKLSYGYFSSLNSIPNAPDYLYYFHQTSSNDFLLTLPYNFSASFDTSRNSSGYGFTWWGTKIH